MRQFLVLVAVCVGLGVCIIMGGDGVVGGLVFLVFDYVLFDVI